MGGVVGGVLSWMFFFQVFRLGCSVELDVPICCACLECMCFSLFPVENVGQLEGDRPAT